MLPGVVVLSWSTWGFSTSRILFPQCSIWVLLYSRGHSEHTGFSQCWGHSLWPGWRGQLWTVPGIFCAFASLLCVGCISQGYRVFSFLWPSHQSDRVLWKDTKADTGFSRLEGVYPSKVLTGLGFQGSKVKVLRGGKVVLWGGFGYKWYLCPHRGATVMPGWHCS